MRTSKKQADLGAFEHEDLTPRRSMPAAVQAETPIEFIEPKGHGGTIADDRPRDLTKIKGTIAEMTQSLVGRMEAMSKEEILSEWTEVLTTANSRSKRGSMSAKKLLNWIRENKTAGKTFIMHRITSSYLAGAGMEVG